MSADDIKLPPRTATIGDVQVWDEEAVRAAILADRASRAPSPQGDAWQPIETAPKDGTRVLLATPRGRMADGEFHARYGVWSWPYVMVEPTLWRPLPTPPIDAARSTPATEKGAEHG
ncbi:hypothetical protein N5K27_22655 [Pigmentiphaga sp. GD03639]|uniref:hypothetical protein n=1 Tax=Pigmentiphaga sp. GD03639 TaxID=2975354 RepID=UPI00244B40FB|nr:hypothetical protein [Pigmentiphaga sp. GD03639]MDH2239114.1 hypothetical protein [Pigmentiphaga sp. GD03639]